MSILEATENDVICVQLPNGELITGKWYEDRITTKLIEAGYRPDGSSVIESKRKAYESGQTVEGKYIRLPQETWTKK